MRRLLRATVRGISRQLNVEPRLLLVHRDPGSNIRSFSRKGKVPSLWAEALWQRTYQQALLAIRTLPDECWAITRFEDLLQQPQASVLELCEWLQHPINAKQRDQLAARKSARSFERDCLRSYIGKFTRLHSWLSQ